MFAVSRVALVDQAGPIDRFDGFRICRSARSQAALQTLRTAGRKGSFAKVLKPSGSRLPLSSLQEGRQSSSVLSLQGRSSSTVRSGRPIFGPAILIGWRCAAAGRLRRKLLEGWLSCVPAGCRVNGYRVNKIASPVNASLSHNAGDFGGFLVGAPMTTLCRGCNLRNAQTLTWTSMRLWKAPCSCCHCRRTCPRSPAPARLGPGAHGRVDRPIIIGGALRWGLQHLAHNHPHSLFRLARVLISLR